MTYDGQTRRLRERLKLSLPVRVECRESADFSWMEMSRLIDVTPFGARFPLAHMMETGRLLRLTLPMPRQLRCFDHVEPQYRIWAIVRNMRPHAPKDVRPSAKAEAPRFEVGVAFIGKRPPASYEQDPSTRYDIENVALEECAYKLTERKKEERNSSSHSRAAETRLFLPVDVLIETFDEDGKPPMSEQTVTENISRRGAAVWTTLPLERGRFLRLTSLSQNLSVTAVIRARRVGLDGITRLHLEFIDREWPLDGLE